MSDSVRVALIAGAFGLLGTICTLIYNNNSTQQSSRRGPSHSSTASRATVSWPLGAAAGILIGIIFAVSIPSANAPSPSTQPNGTTSPPSSTTQANSTHVNLPPSAVPAPPTISAPTPIPTEIPTAVPALSTSVPATVTATSCIAGSEVELLPGAWHLVGKGTAGGLESAEPPTVPIDWNIVRTKDVLRVTLDLHGRNFGQGALNDESSIFIVQGLLHAASVAKFGQNGLDGEQAIYIPLSEFISIPDLPSNAPGGDQLDLNQPFGPLQARFWNRQPFTVDISSIAACNGKH
jgi:hypothetical protein